VRDLEGMYAFGLWDEAARLTLEAEQNLADSEHPDALARSIINSMREEFSEEVQRLEDNHEDNPRP
jgi:hypothetical protein